MTASLGSYLMTPSGRVVSAIVFAVFLGEILPDTALSLSVLGDIFIKLLKSFAPFLILSTIASAIVQSRSKQASKLAYCFVLGLAVLTASASAGALIALLFPVELAIPAVSTSPPQTTCIELQTRDIGQLLFEQIASNPLSALLSGNFLCVFVWAIGAGLVIRMLPSVAGQILLRINNLMIHLASWAVSLTPIGIFGIVCGIVSTSGLETFSNYARFIGDILIALAVVVLVVLPLVYWLTARQNPFPLLIECAKTSAVTAFFLRSSISNIPVNLELCRKLKLDENFYRIIIPLAASIHMPGASLIIALMSLCAAHTVGIFVTIPQVFIVIALSVMTSLAAAGIPSGASLLMPIPMLALGITSETAMHFVAISIFLGIVQDSLLTALNSASDVFLAKAAEEWNQRKQSDIST